MPIGVLMNVAVSTITTLPKIALASPPADPGGGVLSRKSFGDNAATPFANKTQRIHNRNAIPKAIVASDINRLNRLTRSLRRYSGVMFFRLRLWRVALTGAASTRAR